MQESQVVDRLEVVGQPKGDKSCIHIAWNRDIHIAHPPPSLPRAPCCKGGSQGLCWIIHNVSCVGPSDFLISVSASLSSSIHPSREHQQRFCRGLHQRVPDSEWPAGQRKPTLLSRIHSHCQGELLLNGRRSGVEELSQPRKGIESLFYCWINRELWYDSVLNQCSVWDWYRLKRPVQCSISPWRVLYIKQIHTIIIMKDFKVNTSLNTD